MTDIVERWPHRRIYLEPRDSADPSTGPMWAQDDVGSEDENGAVAWEPYVKETELTTLRAENEQLRVALEPFANAADGFDSYNIKNPEEWFAYSGVNMNGKRIGSITVSDLRRARATFTTQEKQNG